MVKRALLVPVVVLVVAVCLLGASPAGAQATYVGGRELVRPTPVVGGTEQVRAPARAGESQTQVLGRQIAVTGADIATLAAIGAGCIAVGVALRRRRPQLAQAE
jgi:hypothetical protein